MFFKKYFKQRKIDRRKRDLEKEVKKASDEVSKTEIFSPNRDRKASIVQIGRLGLSRKGFVMIIKGEDCEYVSKGHMEIKDFIFSPYGNRFAYIAMEYVPHFNTDIEFVVLDGKKKKIFNNVWNPAFSTDEQHFAYVGDYYDYDKGEWRSVTIVDGRVIGRYDDTWRPDFSPDGQYVVYGARRWARNEYGTIIYSGQQKEFIVIGRKKFGIWISKKLKAFQRILYWDFYTKEDYLYLVYTGEQGGKEFNEILKV